MAELQPLTGYASVQAWFEGLHRHWGGDPEHDDPERLEIIEAFCRFADRDPDAVIAECLLVKDGEKRIRTKGRQRCADLIAEFQSGVEGPRMKRAKWGNTVRSFLIHNGIMLQSGVQGGESGS
ncbi:MAG: hypothetical protein WEE64_05645 [Dehalococcoidia bacterium]